MSDLIATTVRLIIRKIEDSDQDLVYSLYQESSDFVFFSDYAELYRKVCWDETNGPNTYNGMIFEKDSGVFVGRICMQHIDRDLPELGIDIMKAHQNHGYGPEAIIAFCNWYSSTYGQHEAKVRISAENTHSMHIFEKLGAEYDKATSYLSKGALDVVREKCPDIDLSAVSQNSVRDYILKLPISRGE